jgi:hypothetical protein
MTHGPPLNHLDKVEGPKVEDPNGRVGCPHLLRALGRVRPRVHCFGHIHEGWGAERVRWGPADQGKEEEEKRNLSDQTQIPGGIEEASASSDYQQVVATHKYETTQEEMVQNRCAHVNIADDSDNPLKFGQETLLVNAAIMDIRYRPLHAPWMVDLELPLGPLLMGESPP